jgi:hypothetical protein
LDGLLELVRRVKAMTYGIHNITQIDGGRSPSYEIDYVMGNKQAECTGELSQDAIWDVAETLFSRLERVVIIAHGDFINAYKVGYSDYLNGII